MKKQSLHLGLLALIVLLLYGIFSASSLFVSLNHALKAQKLLQESEQALSSQNYDRLISYLPALESELAQAHSIQRYSWWLAYLPIFGVDYKAYAELLSAGSKLTSSAHQIVLELQQGQLSQIISFDTFDLQSAPSAYLSVHTEVMEALQHIQNAEQLVNELHIEAFPSSLRPDLFRLQNILNESISTINIIKPILEQAPFLLGADKPHEILLILQNPHELRPTGGFIGTIGRLVIDQGVIEEFYTDDVYNIDVKALGREQSLAPEAIREYTDVEHWYLRDANWSPDFSKSAKQIAQLYSYQTDGEEPATIVALTPYIVQQFLELTGPIEVDGITFTSKNLIDELQFRVEQEFWQLGLADEERKIVINHLAQALKQRLFNLEKETMLTFVSTFLSTLDQKEILLYTTDSATESVIQSKGWGGIFPTTDSDFIAVIDANLGALKTDRLVDRSRTYTVVEDENGRLKAQLEIRYKNNGFFDYRTTRYRTYTRIYVPIGSEFISSTGFVTEDKSSRYVKPEIYSDLDKTVFAGFISIEPGQERYARVEYYLPDRIVQQYLTKNAYHLYLLKQPGVLDTPIHVTLKLKKELFSLSPSTIESTVIDPYTLDFSTKINKDTEITVTTK